MGLPENWDTSNGKVMINSKHQSHRKPRKTRYFKGKKHHRTQPAGLFPDGLGWLASALVRHPREIQKIKIGWFDQLQVGINKNKMKILNYNKRYYDYRRGIMSLETSPYSRQQPMSIHQGPVGRPDRQAFSRHDVKHQDNKQLIWTAMSMFEHMENGWFPNNLWFMAILMCFNEEKHA